MIYFVILDYDNVRKKSNKPKILMSHHRNVYYIKDTSQQIKHPSKVF